MLKDKLLNAKKCNLKPLPIPEWDLTVFLRRWTLTQRSQFIEWSGQGDRKIDALCEKVLPLSLCEEDGKPVLTPDDWPQFKDHDGEILMRICLEAMSHNGFNNEAVDAAKKN